jgi:hypothetical protein
MHAVSKWLLGASRGSALPVLVLLAGVGLAGGVRPASAQLVSEPTRLGSFAGAMRYCEDRYGGTERRYRRARLRVAEALDGMDRSERFRALAARDRAFERGQFLGEPLDKTSCRELLKLSEWKAFAD